MNWREPLDLYCERTGPELLSEPLNALTNLAFVFAALALLRTMPARSAPDLRALAWLLALVGLGSMVFHTIAERWASVLDIGFIALFVVLFVQRALVRLHGWRNASAALVLPALIALCALIASALRVDALNGSELYLGPWLALVALALSCPRSPSRRWLAAAAGLFALSLAFRSLDLHLCKVLPIGTHFGWHLNNALVLWCAMRALLEPARASAMPRG